MLIGRFVIHFEFEFFIDYSHFQKSNIFFLYGKKGCDLRCYGELKLDECLPLVIEEGKTEVRNFQKKKKKKPIYHLSKFKLIL